MLQGSAAILRRQVQRLTGLVDNMLDASGLSRRALTLQPRELDLAALVRLVVGDLTTAAEDGAAAVHLEIEEPLVGRWDPGPIEQVVVNLVSNAMKFGGGRPVDVGLAVDDAEVVLTVRDHGPGIDPAVRDRIFERFFRTDAATGGLGLGLAVVRETVEAMGGSVAVESEPGHGALFTVRAAARAAPVAGCALTAPRARRPRDRRPGRLPVAELPRCGSSARSRGGRFTPLRVFAPKTRRESRERSGSRRRN
jgi:signal transduction histidine kinase